MKINSQHRYLYRHLLLGGLILTTLTWVFPVKANTIEVTSKRKPEQQVSSWENREASLPTPTPQTHLLLSLSERQVSVYQDDQLIGSYPVAIGKTGWETPTGEFEIRRMVKNPSWEHPWTGEIVPPGGDNPLGERWLGFWTDGTNDIGFHGTPDESVMGQAVSHGCVRMRNEDISQIFEQVSLGTKVIVEP